MHNAIHIEKVKYYLSYLVMPKFDSKSQQTQCSQGADQRKEHEGQAEGKVPDHGAGLDVGAPYTPFAKISTGKADAVL